MTRDAADLVDRLAAALPAIALGVPATLDDTDQEISDELALALRISPRAARRGSPAVVRRRSRHAAPRHDRAAERNPGQLRRRGQQLLLTVDPDGARKRRERARRRRDVSMRPDEHGMAWLSAYLPAEVAHTCFGMIDTHARTTMVTDPDDDRGLGARRADALVDRLLSGALDGNPPSDAAPTIGRDVRINVTVPISVLAGVDDGPGQLDGYGAIDADHVRKLAFGDDTTWRRLLTDPVSDTLLDVGTTRYRPPARLERRVRLH
ncbi:MAG: DUF222 domain-containing protein, partial [Jiangellales bacterium]